MRHTLLKRQSQESSKNLETDDTSLVLAVEVVVEDSKLEVVEQIYAVVGFLLWREGV